MRRLSDVTLDQDPLVLNSATPVVEACRRMSDRRTGSVAVVDDAGRLVGIFTGRDAVGRVLAYGRDAATTRLGEVMTRDPETLSPEQTSIEALRLMWDGGFRHLPMVKDGKVVGVVSRGDFRGMEFDEHERERDLWEHMR
ncbi:MAG: CBS domain-containing protein [Proteobacteria bacterium]|nr:CBS domain-containing protein [Pseudomonadota bacterium]